MDTAQPCWDLDAVITVGAKKHAEGDGAETRLSREQQKGSACQGKAGALRLLQQEPGKQNSVPPMPPSGQRINCSIFGWSRGQHTEVVRLRF